MRLSSKHIYIAIAVLALLIAIGFYFYRQGKKKTAVQYAPEDLPGNPGSQNVGASNDEIKAVANGLYLEMKGLNVFGHNMDFYKRALIYSDTDIVKLYNTFNTLFQSDSGQTLTAWLENELFSSTFESQAITLMERLKKLNCL